MFSVQREERRGIWTKIIFVQEKNESKVKQFRRGVRSPVRQTGKRIMIVSLSQIDPKLTAGCRFMQPIKNWLVTTMVGSWSQ